MYVAPLLHWFKATERVLCPCPPVRAAASAPTTLCHHQLPAACLRVARKAHTVLIHTARTYPHTEGCRPFGGSCTHLDHLAHASVIKRPHLLQCAVQPLHVASRHGISWTGKALPRTVRPKATYTHTRIRTPSTPLR